MWYSLLMKKFWKNPWTKSIVVNIVILMCVTLMTDTAYETNDDYVISLRIADGYPFSSFVNFFLCKILIGMQSLMPGVNVFVCMQITISFICFICITRVFIDTFRNRGMLVVAVFVLAVFAADHYSIIQFTKTSALMLTCGMLLLIHAMVDKKCWGWYAVAFALIYLGTWLRSMNLIVAIGTAGIFLLAWVIINRKNLISGEYLTMKRIFLYVVCLLLIGGAIGTYAVSSEINKSTVELEEFTEYDLYRSLTTDYPVYEDFKKNGSKYEALGIDENDMYLMSNWYLDYNGAASTDSLKEVNKMYSSDDTGGKSISSVVKETLREAMSDMKNLDRRGVHLWLVFGFLLGMILLFKPKYLIYPLAACVFAGIIYMYLFYVGRPLYRATYIVDIGTVVWMLYYAKAEYLRKPDGFLRTNKVVSGVLAAVCVAMLLMCQIPMAKASEQLHSYAVNGCISAEMSDFIDSNKDNFYVFGSGTKGLSEYYSEPTMIPEKGYQKNTLGFGSWGTKSPYLMDKLKAYGLENTFEDLIDNDKVFFFEDKNVSRLETYMNKWYGDDHGVIYFEKVDEIAGHNLWKMKSK